MKKSLALIAFVLGAVLALSACGAHFHQYTQTVVPATCRSIGYTLQLCQCGHRVYLDYTPLASHEFGDWHTYTEPTMTSFGEEERVCVHCGKLEIRASSMLGAASTVFLTENGSFSLQNGEERTTYRAAIYPQEAGWDGKVGYVLSMIRRGDTDGINFGAGTVNEFYLDPCTPDRTYARASAAEQLWQQCLALREGNEPAPAWFPTEGVTGFPIRVFMEDTYLGLYRLIPASSTLLEQETAAVLRAETQSPPCLFAEPPGFSQTADAFTILGYGGSSPDSAKESFAKFSAFVRESSDRRFREKLEQYSDLNALMDYFLLSTFFGLPGGDTAGTVWSTSDGVHWIPSFGSLNNAFGLTRDGFQGTALNGIPAPETKEDGTPAVAYTGDNLLWQKLCRVFPGELMARYALLREQFLTAENTFDLFMEGFRKVDPDLRKLERTLYATLPEPAWSTRHVEAYAKKTPFPDGFLAFLRIWIKKSQKPLDKKK